MAILTADSLTLGYGAGPVVEDLSIEVPDGSITALIGPNGCGKSTLLRGLGRLLKPTSGSVRLDGTDIHDIPARQFARRLALLPQGPLSPGGITVGELVALGRNPHQGWWGRMGEADHAAVARAMELTGVADIAERVVDELSGGQRQRVWIAMVLAQETGILLLDEPTTFLDLAHAIEVLDVIADLNRHRSTTVVMVLHDLNLAARYADHVVLMADGRIRAAGSAADVLTEDLLADAFGLTARVIEDPVSRTPLVVPLGRAHPREER